MSTIALRRPRVGSVQPFAAPSKRVVAAAGVPIGACVGVAVGLLGATKALMLVGGLCVAAVSIAQPSVGLAVLALVTYTRLSDIAITYHGAPSLAQPFVALLALVTALRWRALGGWPPAWNRAAVVVVAYLGACLLSGLFAADWAASVATLVTFAKDALLAFIVVALVRTPAALRAVVWALLTAGLLIATLAIHQYFTKSFTDNYGGLALADLQSIAGEQRGYRVGGPIGDPNYFAQVLLVLVPLGVERARNATRRAARVVAAASTLTATVAVVLTFSRGAALVGAVLAVLLIAHHRPGRRFLVLATVAGLALLPLLPQGYTDRLKTLGGAPSYTESSGAAQSVEGRQRSVQAGLRMFMTQPVVGVGLGNYSAEEPDFTDSATLYSSRQGGAAHNLYVEVAAETGLVGLGAFLALLWGAFRSLGEARSAAVDRAAHELGESLWALRAGLIAYLGSAVFIHAAYPRYLWLLLGLSLAAANLAARPVAEPASPGSS
jgi:O-antigen ligase